MNRVGESAGINRLEFDWPATGVATSGTAFPALPSWIWDYDSLGQVTSSDSSVSNNDRAYEYDAIGNRKKSADSLTLPATDNYVANALNQYSEISNSQISNPSYDDDGNATAYPLPVAPTTNSALVWDGENRMVSSTVGTTATTYLYDAQSRRIAVNNGGASTLFVYDGWNCIAEYTGTTLSKTRLWGTDLSGSMQGAGGVGGLLSESHTSNPQSPIHYPLYDGNGNVSEYLAANGTTAAHFEYDPFGNTVVNTDTTNQFAYRFSTKPRDAGTGLYYYGYRYYDPVTGRWPSRDPIEEKGGVNLYGFLTNGPVFDVDVLGQMGAGGYNWTYGKWGEWAAGQGDWIDLPHQVCCEAGSTYQTTMTGGVEVGLSLGGLVNVPAFGEAFEVSLGVSVSDSVSYESTLQCTGATVKECKQGQVRVTYQERSRSMTGTYYGTYVPGIPTTLNGTDYGYKGIALMFRDKSIPCSDN